MRVVLPILVLLTSCTRADTLDSCLDSDAVIQLDAGWERALLKNDADHLDRLLADDFRWVHNHASQIDTKDGLLQSIAARGQSGMQSRFQSGVEVSTLNKTAVVTGFTVVTRKQGAVRYRFMRTYVESDGACLLLANQTMAMHDDVD